MALAPFAFPTALHIAACYSRGLGPGQPSHPHNFISFPAASGEFQIKSMARWTLGHVPGRE